MSCLTDSGYTAGETTRSNAVTTAARIKQTSAVAIAIANAEQAVNNFKDQSDISRRSLAIAQAQQNRLRDVFWPRELEFLNEFASPEAIEQVEIMGRRYGGRLVSAAAGKFAKALAELRCNKSRYCASAYDKSVQDLLLARSQVIASARILGRNAAFTEYQIRTDTNTKRRLQAVSVGRGLLGDAARLLGDAAGNLSQVGNAALSGLNSALYGFGQATQDYRAGSRQLEAAQSSGVPYQAPPSQGSLAGFGNNVQDFSGYGIGLGEVNASMEATESSDRISYDFDTQLRSQSDRFSPNQGLQQERWNEGRIGYQSLARTGIFQFPVIGASGGVVNVDMSKFAFGYTDGYDEGEYGPPSLG